MALRYHGEFGSVGWAWGSQFEHRLGRFGYPAHVVCALIWMILCVGPISVVELGGMAVLFCWFARLPFVWRSFIAAFRQPLWIAVALLTAWGIASLAWSSSTERGWAEIANVRWAWLAFVLLPVLDRRELLVRALAVGFAIAGTAQILEVLGIVTFSHPPIEPGSPVRYSGWWHQPAVGGAMLAAAAGLHTPVVVFGRGKLRWFAAAGLALALWGLVMTGTRSAWISAAAVVGVVAWLRLASRFGAARSIAVVAAAALLFAIAGWFAIGERGRERVTQGGREVQRAVLHGEYGTDTGDRLALMAFGVEAFAQHPIRGLGAGGYRDWCEAHAQGTDVRPQNQAHNMWIHAAATLGIVGVALLLAITIFALLNAAAAASGAMGRYESGILFALLALLIQSLFDTVYVNGPTAAIVLTLCGSSFAAVPRHLRSLRGGLAK